MPSNILLCTVSFLLAALLWRGTHAKALPCAHSQDSDGQKCGQLAKVVLSNISELLNNATLQQHLFWGFNCSEMIPKANSRTTTAYACAPAVSGTSCSGLRAQNMPFNETDCLVNIRSDMEHYKNVLEAYPDDNLSRMVKATGDMLEQCNWAKSESAPSSEKLCASGDTFSDRMCLCEVVQGFKLRAVTINRALSYISSGEHLK